MSLLPRPSTAGDLAPRLVVLDASPHLLNCRWCGEAIIECGYECQYDSWVHETGGRRGSHKCGRIIDPDHPPYTDISTKSAEPGP